ncbi:CcoQ/FixQ family Cbb3-type cytochrome c oxidase assembly chaperone [Epilithonimonas hominis]|uniref:CcoQ/FixQ family Cbb3-type cytochrome c oxidase assembly chaperone n=1 Tax=Epilithonimonas hominis TaxID=420404 RepID=A0A3N0X577_9FLAO|nr:CcoQ/FixQ family Cbb3-type cytochrome c oxidase assembly chaperone [Epilithonimonas hominis]ROI12554.1 CcoQ/FixQ family Cbb3-type cytochrome c oxidase assembly chaperone [Epilithonimonas hominis]
MIPQSFKDIVSNVNNAGFFQTLAMIIFILFFVAVIYVVVSKPKKYYSEEENAPLEKDEDENQTL